jgi:glycosyltransferase involved in cell wall biosynthesis
MKTYKKLKGAVTLASNSPGMPTGYGTQSLLLAERMIRHGLKFASLSNYGIEGRHDTLEIGGVSVPHYPRGLNQYSTDVMPVWTNDFASKHPDLKTVLFTLYDVWVYNDLQYDGQIVSWVPLDHITLPPGVNKFLTRENVMPITMSIHGQEQLNNVGIENTYIPHAIDTNVFKPTDKMPDGQRVRDYMSVPDDAFLVGMVAANKAAGLIHRKAFAENLLAFAIHLKKYPNSYLYIHSEPSRVYGGFDLGIILRMVGIPQENVLLPDSFVLRNGFSDETMAAFYSAFDVLLSTSYGEGFGIPTIEAQACGTRVITSNFAASKDLASEDSWKIEGQPFWDEAQSSFFQIPSINKITAALEEAYHAERGTSKVARKFALQYDVEKVWNEKWMPFLKDLYK